MSEEMGVVTTLVITVIALVASCQAVDDKVTVGFYGESLCPDCIAFCTGPLHKAVQEVLYNTIVYTTTFL